MNDLGGGFHLGSSNNEHAMLTGSNPKMIIAKQQWMSKITFAIILISSSILSAVS
jgi:hypothetical protein